MEKIYNTIVAGNQKAVIGFVLTLVAGLGLQVGGVNVLDATVGQVIAAVVSGVITSAGVWFKTNK